LTSLTRVVYGSTGWEAVIKVQSHSAENKLALGMQPDALDGVDARYDIPAYQTGDASLNAYMDLNGNQYWRDMRFLCNTKARCLKAWEIVINTSSGSGSAQLIWNPMDFPQGTVVSLMDTTTGKSTNMKQRSQYSYQSTGSRRFIVEVKQ
jgi:hypothetical protein